MNNKFPTFLEPNMVIGTYKIIKRIKDKKESKSVRKYDKYCVKCVNCNHCCVITRSTIIQSYRRGSTSCNECKRSGQESKRKIWAHEDQIIKRHLALEAVWKTTQKGHSYEI